MPTRRDMLKWMSLAGASPALGALGIAPAAAGKAPTGMPVSFAEMGAEPNKTYGAAVGDAPPSFGEFA